MIGKCGRSHQGPKDQQEQFCGDVAKMAGLKVPYVARNYHFWQNSPSGHVASEAKRTKRSHSAAPGDDDDKSE